MAKFKGFTRSAKNAVKKIDCGFMPTEEKEQPTPNF